MTTIDTSTGADLTAAMEHLAQFPLLASIYGRRSRRFALGDEIPDGPLAYKSGHDPLALSDLERLIVLTSMAGTTGWHYAITRHERYAPHLSNYAGGAAGRTFPSAAGFHTTEFFFTDDSGTYFLPTRDAGALVDPADEDVTPELMVARHKDRIVKLSDQRIDLPREEPAMEGHNTWCVNVPGSLWVIPVADLAQHAIACLCFLVQNGIGIYDDINDREVPGTEGLERFPLTFFDQYCIGEAAAEIATSCYAGALTLQALGLGGWMFDGIDRFSLLPAIGFRQEEDERSPIPNPLGLDGVFEPMCPPYHDDMTAAVEAFCERKFGAGGPFNAGTPGAWSESSAVRSSAQVHDAAFRASVSAQAQYVYDTFGRFPGTHTAAYTLNMLQAHHLDLDFYDEKFRPGAYLQTHAEHMQRWHG